MSQQVKQIVVYRIRPNRRDEFRAIKNTMIEEGLALAGLQTSTTHPALDAEDTFVDTMVWASAEAARAGNAKFPQLPSAGAFMGLMAGPPVSNLLHAYDDGAE